MDKVALKVAIDLMHVPSQVRLRRAEPLPEGVPLLLRVASGDEQAEQSAAELAARPRETVRRASIFFIEQILFAPDADSYRVLGAERKASAGELRRNVALLLRWLHPDLDRQGRRSGLVGRVTAAWNDLKTPERRAAYDETVRRAGQRSDARKSERSGRRRRAAQVMANRQERYRDWPATYGWEEGGFLRRALSVLLNRPPR